MKAHGKSSILHHSRPSSFSLVALKSKFWRFFGTIYEQNQVTKLQSVGFLASECVGVALSSNQGNSPLRSENTGFHFALTSAKLPALRSVETPTPNPCEVRECSFFWR